jgi:hypothetical protein
MVLERTKWQIIFSHLTMLMMEGGSEKERMDWTMNFMMKKSTVVME